MGYVYGKRDSEGDERSRVVHACMRACVLRAACCVLRAACCVLRVACCVLRVACCVLHVACCMLHVDELMRVMIKITIFY